MYSTSNTCVHYASYIPPYPHARCTVYLYIYMYIYTRRHNTIHSCYILLLQPAHCIYYTTSSMHALSPIYTTSPTSTLNPSCMHCAPYIYNLFCLYSKSSIHALCPIYIYIYIYTTSPTCTLKPTFIHYAPYIPPLPPVH